MGSFLHFYFNFEFPLPVQIPPVKDDVLRNLVRASLVVQWLGVCLPMQGTWVRAVVREDPTCRGAARPVRHNC